MLFSMYKKIRKCLCLVPRNPALHAGEKTIMIKQLTREDAGTQSLLLCPDN